MPWQYIACSHESCFEDILGRKIQNCRIYNPALAAIGLNYIQTVKRWGILLCRWGSHFCYPLYLSWLGAAFKKAPFLILKGVSCLSVKNNKINSTEIMLYSALFIHSIIKSTTIQWVFLFFFHSFCLTMK